MRFQAPKKKKALVDIRQLQNRLQWMLVLVVMLSCALVIRLAYMQMPEYGRYQTLSLKNQLAVTPITPPRGIILDRNGVVLADNMPVYVLEITPEHVKNINQTLHDLQQLITSITDDDIDNFQKLRHQNRKYVPLPLKLKLNQDEVATFSVHQYKFPGVNIKARLMRYYPLKDITAHVVGYVSRINIDELRQVDSTNYRGTNFIGKTGIEKFYEDSLHGKVGYQEAETDVSGRTLRIMNKIPPTSGDKLVLTIDSRLQQKALESFGEKRGALVLINPNNGEILAMASSPSYDPNLFVNGISSKDYQQLAFTRERPLYNRATRGLYPPASTVKPFIGLAGLHNGFVTPSLTVYDPGTFHLPHVRRAYRDWIWKRGGHGVVNLKRAITVSCDIYFYSLGARMGITLMGNMLKAFGLGQATGVDIPDEAIGVVPSIEWKRKVKHQPWYPGDTIISAIGQGFTLVTPLQLANAVAGMSARGIRHTPHFLFKSVKIDGNKSIFYQAHNPKPVKVNDLDYWQTVIEGMQAVIESGEGTAHYKFGLSKVYTAGAKTGTAQVFSGRQFERTNYLDIPEAFRDNSLFIAFAPVENPEIAIAVIVENDTAAAHVARDVIDEYFRLKELDHHDDTN